MPSRTRALPQPMPPVKAMELTPPRVTASDPAWRAAQ